MARKTKTGWKRVLSGLGPVILKLLRRHPWIVDAIKISPRGSKLFSRILIELNAGYGAPRPRPLSLHGPYTSWPALQDRSYTGRQLGPDGRMQDRRLPPAREVARLFERQGDGTESARSSVLFAYVAQWFTDSFVRSLPENEPGNWRRNSSNHEIDLCQVYGKDTDATAALRAPDDSGRLKVSIDEDGREYPPLLFKEGSTAEKPRFAEDAFKSLYDPVRLERALQSVPPGRLAKLYATGLEQGNATPGNLVLGIVFLRAHNHVAGEIKRAHPDWSGERVFETARNVMIVIFMQIVLHDYVRHISPIDFPFELDPNVGERRSWKRSNWINIEFGLLYRWHPLVPDTLRVDGAELGIADTLWNPELVTSKGIATLISAASRQPAGKIALGNTPRFFTDTRPMLMDGAAVDVSIQEKTIQMARRAELRPYNAYREEFGMEPVGSFLELTEDAELARRLEQLYGHVDDLEWYVGLFAEAHGERMIVGELLLRMVAFDAFTHIFGNPLISKGVFVTETFSEVGMQMIERTKRLDQVVAWAVPPGTPVHVSFDYRL